MIAYEEALARVLAQARPLPPERVPLEKSLGRCLARDVAAREPIPRFEQSAMDGYAVRAADLAGATETRPARLKIIGEIRAGDKNIIRNRQSASRKRSGERARAPALPGAFRIFTGAKIPRGVDAVVMKEFCREEDGGVLIQQAVATGANIRRRGEEFGKGARVLAAGTRVTPPVVGLLATLNCARPWVHRAARVALIVTGNELKGPGGRLKAGQIRDANSYALTAALEAAGFAPVSVTRVGDDRAAIRRRLAAALERADVVLTVGGVSVGDYDFVKEAAADLGVETVYWKVAIKPGMPNYFGIQASGKGRGARKKLLFGLPGNPVAALVSFHQLVRPALAALAGAKSRLKAELPNPNATLTRELRKKPGRLEWVRAVLTQEAEGLTVTPTGGQESHMLGGLAAANCLIEFPAESSTLGPGESVRVQPLHWEGD